ncbi:uncharacterized protein LOC121882816 [Thunnus maccoyii]|uniref:uncharacterized protein LOC121882816 n=1 Tax=Thunnus maccoyii TaxID=8240 RepID=UPI001C4D089A|nr:uncharacterized protein LOC121882816 [Thunnus maccoyii]
MAMDEERAHSYPDLKAALLSMALPSRENPAETYHRLKGLYRRWIRPVQHTKEQIGEQIILEQLLRVFPADIRTWVKEHEPIDGLAAAKLAQQYINARRGGPASYQGGPRRQPSSQPRPAARANPHLPGERRSAPSQHSSSKELICFYCQQAGHKASLCPIRKAKLSGACYTPRAEDGRAVGRWQHFKDITIYGEPVTALVDSVSFLTLVQRDLVPTGIVDYSRQEDILCVHGDSHSCPTADLTVVVDEQPYLMTVGVVEKLPVAAILGWDLPVLLDVLLDVEAKDSDGVKGLSGQVITRAQARAGVTSDPWQRKGPDPEPFSTLDSSLFEGGTKGPRKSRCQRRFEKGLKTRQPDCKEGLTKDIWKVPGDIGALQRVDGTLKTLFTKAVGGLDMAKEGKECFVIDKDVLYALADGVKRLVVPGSCRPMIMHLAHTLPWSGHLGRNKTYLRLASRFYWPSMYTDVQTFCRTCPTCQKTCYVCQSDRAYLQPLPIISTPFRRIAMDIVGPLVRSSRGHQYILVVCDYATRFPEAFPLCTVTAPAVLRCLAQLFSRVGVPDEIITDQGTNFTSRLLQLFHRQLGIAVIKTTPYHPQTDGLVERFNQTLKKMLQKFVADTGRDWDQWLPFLFAYREVPQASTGFSPFELLYGWDVQGPLDLLLKTWEAPASCSLLTQGRLTWWSTSPPERQGAGSPEVLSSAPTPGGKAPEGGGGDAASGGNRAIDGSLRICIDFRKLNAMSEFDAYPMPRIDDLLEKIGQARFITTLDLCKGYWQVPLEASNRPYTAFQTPAGLFQFTVMPFGLHGAPATFQRLMDCVLQGCEDCSAAYLDDVVIFSDTWEQHLCHLERVLGQIQQAGLTLNPAKCEVRPQVDKVEAIRGCPRPRTKKEVRSFLGLAGWYRRFVPQFATIAAPLTALTAKDQRNPVAWNEDCETAFQTLKACLCSSPVLRSPDFSQRFLVQTDASAVGLGAVLAQGDPGEEQPVLYLSRKLLPRETRYSTVEKEGLAIKWALESLRYYLLGREFDLETDHRALIWMNFMKDHNSRLTRWYLSLQPFQFQIRHRAGKTNVVADYLSRLPHIANLGEEGDNVTGRP